MYYACYKIEHIGGQMKNVISMGGKEEKKKVIQGWWPEKLRVQRWISYCICVTFRYPKYFCLTY